METFVVRVWRAEDPSEASGSWAVPLRGFVEHVGTGTATRFGGGEELLRFLREPPLTGDSEATGNASPQEGDPR